MKLICISYIYIWQICIATYCTCVKDNLIYFYFNPLYNYAAVLLRFNYYAQELMNSVKQYQCVLSYDDFSIRVY